MKTILATLFVVIMAVSAFAWDANAPQQPPPSYPPCALTDQIDYYTWVDLNYRDADRLAPDWFNGEIRAYQIARDAVSPYGMRYTQDPDFQRWEEQSLLRFILEAWLFQQYAKTGEEYAYYGGMINGFYRVLEYMNNTGAAGYPIPGTTINGSSDMSSIIANTQAAYDYDPFANPLGSY